MSFSANRNLIRWMIIISSFVIVSLILWNTYVFFQHFKAEERSKMTILSKAQDEISRIDITTEDLGSLHIEILSSNNSIPLIKVSKEGEVSHANIDEEKAQNPKYIEALIEQFKKENEPIVSKYEDELVYTLYYGNSPLINKLKFYPLALLLIILLFAAVVYFFYRSSKNAQQNKLWTGMAKETAHQIGTPLSSLVGWTEILKSENVNPDYITEIEKDIDRLQIITERFSKIGSIPVLDKVDIVALTKESYQYLELRSSKQVNFNIEIPEHDIPVKLNAQLYSWTIENLVKNAIDAMKGKGDLKLELKEVEKQVFVTVLDTGKGISKADIKKIFEPGFTTKKRGWGLGLSLAKRIIEDYHGGKIKVLHSEIGKGTTFQIVLKRVF